MGGPALANIWLEVSAAGFREAVFVLRGAGEDIQIATLWLSDFFFHQKYV